jgi:tetratricopeptide (TPR) repeat protein
VGIVALVVLVFSGTLHVPFFFDDIDAIKGNPNIRTLWPLWIPLSWPATLPATTGRPFVSLTLALNYAVHGLHVEGYHVVSLGLHAASALLLLGIIRRTLAGPGLQGRFGISPLTMAAAIVALWAVHPLQTEPVTYVIVRTELLVSFCYLLTLYAAIRAWDSPRAGRWEALAILACALGMASKEIMVSAPLMVVLYDHVFLRGAPGATRPRRRLYAGLAATWVVLAGLLSTGAMFQAGTRRDWGLAENLWMQSKVLFHYLRLVFWPSPLVVTYDWPGPTSFLQALPFVLALAAAFLASGWGVWHRRGWGFLGAWFFLILAPTSSFIPLPSEVASERRMYLPLAAVLTLAVLAACLLLERLAVRGSWPPSWRRAVALGSCALLLLILGTLSMQRIHDYETPLKIWGDAVAKSPGSMLARNNYSRALVEAGRPDEAMDQSLESLRVVPRNNPIGQQNVGYLLVLKGKLAEALPYLEEAIRLQPNRAPGHFVLGRALATLGRSKEATEQYRRAFELDPSDLEACGALAMSLARAASVQEGEAQMQECIRRWPGDPRLRNNLASLMLEADRPADAVRQLSESVRLDPSYALGRFNLSLALLRAGRTTEGLQHLVRAYRDSASDAALRRRIVERALSLEAPVRDSLLQSLDASGDAELRALLAARHQDS